MDQPRIAGAVADLPHSASIEVTAVDSFLTEFLFSNNPFGYGLNLLMDKPELTNISGEHIGVFGSINHSEQFVWLNSCTKYLSNLTSGQFPPADCEE